MITSRPTMSTRRTLLGVVAFAALLAGTAAAAHAQSQDTKPGDAALSAPPPVEITPEVEALADAARARAANKADENVVRAGEARDAFLEREEEFADERRRLARALGVTEDEAGDSDVSPTDDHGDLPTLVLFVSSSVPLPTLRAYAAQLERVNGAMVFRGMPGGMQKVQPFLELGRRILLVDQSCEGADCATYRTPILVDPILFRHANVDMVPAAAIVPWDVFAAYCEREAEAPAIVSMTYGDAHLTGHLAELERLGDRRARFLTAAYEERTTP